jgi:hypothetical protein
MKEIKDDLAHIRSMMERSSMFISLNGLAGVLVGVLGLMAVWWIKIELEASGLSFEGNVPNYLPQNVFSRLVWAGLITLTLSLVIVFFLTKSKLRKQNASSWDRAIKTVAKDFFTPMVIGGIFCLVLAHSGLTSIVASLMMLIYGMSLLCVHKYLHREIYWFAICQLMLSVASLLLIDKSVYIWGFAFGVLHIVYGGLMYVKYK